MGMFDTYRLAWGDGPEEVQTKQLSCILAQWQIGQRVPLSQFGESIYGNEPDEHLTPSAPSPFQCLIDDTSLGRMWNNANLCERHFIFGHHHGVFADYAATSTHEQAEAHALALAELWSASALAPGLARQLALIKERNENAWSSLLSAQAGLDTLFLSWRADAQIKRFPQPSNGARPLFHWYHGPDFAGVSRREVFTALEAMTRPWANATLEFDGAIHPDKPVGHVQDVALQCARSTGSFLDSNELGSVSPEELFQASAQDLSSQKPTPQRALLFLTQGYWSLFEQDVLALDDKPLYEQSRGYLAKLCLSRLGAHWAAGAMARNPNLAFESMEFDGKSHPLIDWMVCRMGLPTRLAAPLFSTQAKSSSELAHHCLVPSFSALLPLAIERAGGASLVGSLGSTDLPEQALRCSHTGLLTLLRESSGIPERASSGRLLMDLAFEIEERASRVGMPGTDSEPLDFARAPDSIRCIGILLDSGLAPSALPATERLRAFLAMRERRAIEAHTDTGSPPLNGISLRL